MQNNLKETALSSHAALIICFFCLIYFLLLATINHGALAVVMARPIGNESRIKIINYMPNSVIRFVGHYYYQSIIEFAPDETVQTITMGTPTGWQMHPSGNRIFLKPVGQDATTNMTVITNRRMYFFEMHAEYADSINDKSLSFMMKFTYPESNNAGVTILSNNLDIPDLKNTSLYNFDYSISGPKSEIEPLLIFDDGTFTYFKFRNVNADLPAFFGVSPDGSENILNSRTMKGYVIIEQVRAKFTLRMGHTILCVYNNRFDERMGTDLAQ